MNATASRSSAVNAHRDPVAPALAHGAGGRGGEAILRGARRGRGSPGCRLLRRTLLTALLLAAALGSTGCGYSTKRPFPTDIRTVHVEMFHSKEFRRELEFRLTEALVKRIEMDTPYRIAPRETADAVLTGEILHVDNRTFGDDLDTDLPREIASTIVVRFRFQDIRSGDVLVERPRFVYQASYIPPVGETFSKGMVRGLDGLAEQIVESLETDW